MERKKSKWKIKNMIRHFFIIFINLFVRKITKNELITFKIGHKDKRRIKSGDILELIVEKMSLLFSPSKNKIM